MKPLKVKLPHRRIGSQNCWIYIRSPSLWHGSLFRTRTANELSRHREAWGIDVYGFPTAINSVVKLSAERKSEGVKKPLLHYSLNACSWKPAIKQNWRSTRHNRLWLSMADCDLKIGRRHLVIKRSIKSVIKSLQSHFADIPNFVGLPFSQLTSRCNRCNKEATWGDVNAEKIFKWGGALGNWNLLHERRLSNSANTHCRAGCNDNGAEQRATSRFKRKKLLEQKAGSPFSNRLTWLVLNAYLRQRLP